MYQEMIWSGGGVLRAGKRRMAEKRKLRGVNHCKPEKGGGPLFITLPTAIAILSLDHKTNL